MLTNPEIQYLDSLAHSLVKGRGEESECHAILNEVLILHHRMLPRGSFITIARLRLPGAPVDPQLRILDIGLGRFQPDSGYYLQGGVKVKKTMPAMAAALATDTDADDTASLAQRLRFELNFASIEAVEQAKAAVRNGHLPNDCSVRWMVTIRPYFTIIECSPFSRADLETCVRGHTDPSGDAAAAAQFIGALHDSAGAHTRPIHGPIHCFGEPGAHQALEEYLTSNVDHFYLPTANRYTAHCVGFAEL